jgi:tRNA (cmo5U34)-methyltransferase
LNCTLVDLSRPMLDRAVERVTAAGGRNVRAMQGDMRAIDFGQSAFDIVLAAATLHHLRTDAEWRNMFAAIFRALRPGGSFWIFDMVEQVDPAVHRLMWERYGRYLSDLKGGGEAGEVYRKAVFAYVEEEDSPKPLVYQLELLREVGFGGVDVLHKNGPFAAFGGARNR